MECTHTSKLNCTILDRDGRYVERMLCIQCIENTQNRNDVFVYSLDVIKMVNRHNEYRKRVHENVTKARELYEEEFLLLEEMMNNLIKN